MPPARETIGRAEGPARGDDRDHVVLRPGDHHADGHVAIVRRVGRVERAIAVREADLALDAPLDLRPERARVDGRRRAARRSGARRAISSSGVIRPLW